MSKGTNNVEKVFIWRFTSKKQAKEFERFSLASIVRGQSAKDTLLALIKDFTEAEYTGIDFVPVTEKVMLEELRRLKFKSTRQWLKGLRDRGELDGLWFTDGKSIVYNKGAVTKFVKDRMKKGAK